MSSVVRRKAVSSRLWRATCAAQPDLVAVGELRLEQGIAGLGGGRVLEVQRRVEQLDRRIGDPARIAGRAGQPRGELALRVQAREDVGGLEVGHAGRAAQIIFAALQPDAGHDGEAGQLELVGDIARIFEPGAVDQRAGGEGRAVRQGAGRGLGQPVAGGDELGAEGEPVGAARRAAHNRPSPSSSRRTWSAAAGRGSPGRRRDRSRTAGRNRR